MLSLSRSVLLLVLVGSPLAAAETETDPPAARIDGTAPGWTSLGPDDFVDVNGNEDTWQWDDGLLKCSGTPVGVIRSARQYENFELVLEWQHQKPAGNSGVFVWTLPESLDGLPPGKLPEGIEVQILDPGYGEQYTQRTGKVADWFTSHGDVFAVGSAKMKPFPPLSPNGSRSFPTAKTTLPSGNWNHYYVRAINGEVRLWVNGTEVSGGTECRPSKGYLCLESEGSPIVFRNLRIRELP